MSLHGQQIQSRGQLVEARQGLGQRGVGQMVLAQEVEQRGAQTDAGVELRIGARHVGAELDQILGVAVGGEGGANFAPPASTTPSAPPGSPTSASASTAIACSSTPTALAPRPPKTPAFPASISTITTPRACRSEERRV